MDTIGHNDRQASGKLSAFLIPSLTEAVLLLVGSLLLLCLGNLHLIWSLVSSGAAVSQSAVGETLQPSFDLVNQFLGQEFFSRIVVFIVWGFVGCLAYMITWGIQRTASQAKQDINQRDYVRSASTKSYWQSKTSHYIYAVCAWFVLIVFIFGFCMVLWPSAQRLMATAIIQPRDSWSFLIEAVVIVGVSLYCLVRLWRAAHYTLKMAA